LHDLHHLLGFGDQRLYGLICMCLSVRAVFLQDGPDAITLLHRLQAKKL
jgi:hypothetical protein